MKRLSLLVVLTFCPIVLSVEPLVSGLKPGQRPGPYAAVVCTGPNRGKAHCYICEAADRPTVILLARKMTDPLGKLVQGFDKALVTHRSAELRSWLTFLYEDQSAVDSQVVAWGKTHGISEVPLAVFEDADGPPAYLLHKEAEVTVLPSPELGEQLECHSFSITCPNLLPRQRVLPNKSPRHMLTCSIRGRQSKQASRCGSGGPIASSIRRILSWTGSFSNSSKGGSSSSYTLPGLVSH